jgi:hypothetical protein
VVVTVPADAAVNDNATLYVTVNGVASNKVPITILSVLKFTNPNGRSGNLPEGYLSTPYCQQQGDNCQPAVGNSLPYFQFTATGGTPPYAFNWSAGSGQAPYNTLPESLTFSAPGGSLSGTLFPKQTGGGYTFSTSTTLAGTYNFTVTVTDSGNPVRSTSLNASMVVAPAAILSSLAAFQDCIGAYGPVLGYNLPAPTDPVQPKQPSGVQMTGCQLAAGRYNVGPTAYLYDGVTPTVPFTDSYGNHQHQLVIGRSNLVITGTDQGGGAADTVLRRGDPTYYGLAWDSAIMTAAEDAGCPFCPSDLSLLPITNVTIEYLTFDGNRYDWYGEPVPSGPPPPAPIQCTTAQLQYIDLYLGPGFKTTGGIFTVWWDDFINSPDTALLLAGTGSVQTGLASTVSYSNFGQGGYGIESSGGRPGTAPDLGSATGGRFTAIYMEGAYTGAYYNAVSYAGTTGLTLDTDGIWHSGGYGQFVYGNHFFNNRYEGSDNASGGQLAMYPSTSWSTWAGNVIDGNNWKTNSQTVNGCPVQAGLVSEGVEVNGTGHRFYNNEIANNVSGGMAIGTALKYGDTFNTAQIVVSASNPWYPSDTQRYIENNGGDGIVVYGGYRCPDSDSPYCNTCRFPDGSPGPCHTTDPTFDQVQGLTLDTLQILNNKGFGVSLYYVDNYTDGNGKQYLGFSQENPNGVQSQATMCGNGTGDNPDGTIVYTRFCDVPVAGVTPVPRSYHWTSTHNDVYWCYQLPLPPPPPAPQPPPQPTYPQPSSFNRPPSCPLPPAKLPQPAPSPEYPYWPW